MSTPFRQMTQRQFNQLSTVTYNAGSLSTFRLPETGLGARLYINVQGVLNVALNAGTATLSSLGIKNLLARLTVRLNDGTILYEMQGWNTKIANIVEFGFDPETTYTTRNFSSASPYQAPSAGAVLSTTTYTVNFTIEVPFINNEKDMLGLILLQNGTTQATVEMQFNPITGADSVSSLVKVTSTATASWNSITITPVLEFYSLPNVNSKDLMPMLKPYLSWLSQWKSEYEAIASPAQYNKKLDRGSVYTHIGHYLLQNYTPTQTGLLTSFQLSMKGSETPLTIPYDIQTYLERRNYRGVDLPDGCIMHDMDRSFGIPEFGDERDYIDSRQLTELKSVVNFNQSASFGAGSYIYTITHKLTPVQLG